MAEISSPPTPRLERYCGIETPSFKRKVMSRDVTEPRVWDGPDATQDFEDVLLTDSEPEEMDARKDNGNLNAPSELISGGIAVTADDPTGPRAQVADQSRSSPVVGKVLSEATGQVTDDTSTSASAAIASIMPPTLDASKGLTNGTLTGVVRSYATAQGVDLASPTCSLNLHCYRSADTGCVIRQINTGKRSSLKNAGKGRPELILSDQQLFRAIHEEYRYEMCSFWRRHFSMKKIVHLRLLSYVENEHPKVVHISTLAEQELLHAFYHPSSITTEDEWIDWVFRLRQPSHRYAIELVEGWAGSRIAVAGGVALVASLAVGLAWGARTGDWQTAFTLAQYVLAAGTLILALLAVLSGLDNGQHGNATNTVDHPTRNVHKASV